MGGCLFHLGLLQKHFLITSTPPLSSAYPLLKATPSSSSSSTTTTLSFTERYLVESCGLSLESAVSLSKKIKLVRTGSRDPLSAVQCFKDYNFSKAHIAKLIQKAPWAINCSVEKVLVPKFDFLIGIGFVGRHLPDLVAAEPGILWRSLDGHLMECHQLLRPFYGSDEKFVSSVLRHKWLLSRGFKRLIKANLEFLAKEGVPHNCVGYLLSHEPRLVTQSPERMVGLVNTLKGWGMHPPSPMFGYALGVLSRMSESTWSKKVKLLKSFGWSEEDFLTAFRRQPNFMVSSEDKMRIALDFYMNTMNLGRQDFITYPLLLKYSLERRILPRWNVLQVLKSHNLLENDFNVKPVLLMSDKSFFQKYVTSYADKIPELLEMYLGAKKEKQDR
ncbi:hypothetical protein Tsubulata_035403 [Turnera subulata]|uniref:Uncharacterized protein n=1 Tax=Turnera subulata TaxID=218843 RepID=A0A9Q0G9R7_9ROSI|nr:hypothetical protein Tsubulata_035403 [Turnera subulata]